MRAGKILIGEMQMIRVLVVDDMQPICRRYEKLINQEEDMEARILLISKAITSLKKNGSVKRKKEEEQGPHASCFPK